MEATKRANNSPYHTQLPRHPGKRIRVLAVDDHQVIWAGLVTLMANEPDFEGVGKASSGYEGVRQYVALEPDVTLLDLQMANGSRT